jgi:hypothetical protein
MSLFSKALYIALQKVCFSIYNIIIFRNIYSLVLFWLEGFYAFFLTVYIVGKIKAAASYFYTNVRKRVFILNKEKYPDREHNELEVEFKSEKLSCQLMDTSDESPFTDLTLKLSKDHETDLFSFIFSAASQSTFLNLAVILAIEHVSTKLNFGLGLAMLYCLGLAFVLCFISSFKYMSLLLLDEPETEKNCDKVKKHVIMYDTVDFVCVVETKRVVGTPLPELSVEFKNVSAKYASHVGRVAEYYAKEWCKEGETYAEEGKTLLVVDRFRFVFPDYYDLNYQLSNALRASGYSKLESWTEFRILPLCELGVNVFANFKSQKLKNKNK